MRTRCTQAASLETNLTMRRRVLRKALEVIPNSVKLWQAEQLSFEPGARTPGPDREPATQFGTLVRQAAIDLEPPTMRG